MFIKIHLGMVSKKQTSSPSPNSHLPPPEVTIVTSLGSLFSESFLYEAIEFLPLLVRGKCQTSATLDWRGKYL